MERTAHFGGRVGSSRHTAQHSLWEFLHWGSQYNDKSQPKVIESRKPCHKIIWTEMHFSKCVATDIIHNHKYCTVWILPVLLSPDTLSPTTFNCIPFAQTSPFRVMCTLNCTVTNANLWGQGTVSGNDYWVHTQLHGSERNSAILYYKLINALILVKLVTSSCVGTQNKSTL